ncbi:hypothetical protein, partial [Marinomonas sp. BSi20584]|uniref:hypothetical protein n=1 Tax=Marinomonas sp. BSi20584 TaxID=1594462 RepID=UPI001E293480
MQNQDNYQPSFDRVRHLKQAVNRVVRRRKALGQYIVVANKGEIQRIDFLVKNTTPDHTTQPPRRSDETR